MIVKKLGDALKGEVFLRMVGEQRILGMVYHYIDGDRGPGVNDSVFEDGSRSRDHEGCGYVVIVLDKVEDVGNNPLRTLLNWAGKYGG